MLVMANRDKLRSLDKFDKYIFTEIPDKDKYQCCMILYASI
jgi:hypothetical protein